MKKILLISFFAILLTGCKGIKYKSKTAVKSSECNSNLSKWLQECTNELAKNQPNETHSFNGIRANDAVFIPVSNPAEEIFEKCQNIRPLSAKDVTIYKKCLKECIAEMQSINQYNTRAEVNKFLQQNGGLFSAQASIYSHPICDVLKVVIEFEFGKDQDGRAKFNENDKVKAISTPYLGFFILD